MKLQTYKRKTAYIVCFFLILLGCFAGAVSADDSEKQFKLSTDDIVRGLYNPDNEQLRSTDSEIVKLKEKSVYSRDGLSSLTLNENLQKLALVYNDENVSSYFSKLMKEGIVTGFGVNRLGYYKVWVKSSVDDDEISSLISGFDKITYDTYGKLPIIIQVSDGISLQSEHVEISPFATKLENWRPIIGGIRVQAVTNTGVWNGTIGFAATKNGQSGYVTHGHNLAVGSQMYQPYASPLYPAGTVQAIGSTNSDSSWVPFGNTEASIYSSGSTGNKRAVSAYSSIPDGSKVVVMAGSNTYSYGYVDDVITASHPYYGEIPYQWTATYDSIEGDSGAPVYQQDSVTHEFCLVGLHWGRKVSSDVAVFSPLSGVMSDLGIVPKTR
ncbi:MAG: hypothetical protein IJA20_10290 [Methanocorpusculum sp.]|nr:hypothetical protein [Methanocorpusculum sp.]